MIDRRRFCLALAATLSSQRRGFAADDGGPSLARTYRGTLGREMPYRLLVPRNYNKQRTYSLVLWLHGSGGRGNDNRKQISGANKTGTHVWMKSENQAKYPCFLIAPQSNGWIKPDSWEPTDELQVAVEIVDSIQEQFNIDPQRLYVAGQSMGGYGTWAVISAHPNKFAAAIPICGGGDTSRASLLAQTPIWAFHGERDAVVNVEQSRNMIAAIATAGGNPRYTEYKGAGHEIWNRVFKEQELFPWVFAQKTPPRKINREDAKGAK